MVRLPPKLKTKKEKKKDKEKVERGPVLGNFDEKPTIMTSLRPPVRGKKPTRRLTLTEKKALQRRKREERRRMRKTLKKKVKRPIFVMPEPTNEPDEEEEQANRTPPIHFRLNTKSKSLDVTVLLHHCPPQYVNVDPTATHFVLDTSKWTRKYEVNMPYPDGTECDPEKASAKLERGILSISLPVTKLPKEAREKQAQISAAIREGKRLRFVQARGGELVGMRLAPVKERKRNRLILTEDDDKHVPIPRVGSKKKFVTDKDSLAKLAEEAAAVEESKVAGRQAKMGVTEAYFKEKYAQRMEEKGRKASIADKVLDRIMAQQQQQVNDKVSAVGLEERPALSAGVDARNAGAAAKKKVSFAATNMVVKFGGEGTASGKKKKGKHHKEDVVEYHN